MEKQEASQKGAPNGVMKKPAKQQGGDAPKSRPQHAINAVWKHQEEPGPLGVADPTTAGTCERDGFSHAMDAVKGTAPDGVDA
mmetsp:Transcript_27734/g.73229  ORF Transcript_27734/g.73229 Transcript_27734/m.73229 type:complete len:83 (-) Transcript_27734:2050-2298(-)